MSWRRWGCVPGSQRPEHYTNGSADDRPSNRGFLAITDGGDLEASPWFVERRWSGMTGNSREDGVDSPVSLLGGKVSPVKLAQREDDHARSDFAS
jgi:hypothetical protein